MGLMAHYPESGHNGTTLGSVANDYFDDLLSEYVSSNEFKFAIVQVRKKCKFFPKMADILEAVNEYRKNPPPSKTVRIAEDCGQEAPLTPEQIERNKKRYWILSQISSGRISYEEGTKKIEELL